jgi:hypothetical protein
MSISRVKVLALDLEGTLISNAISQIPRPGLYHFLERCRDIFPRIVMFTTVNEAKFREIARLLVKEGAAPDWFATIEYVIWPGGTKDLTFVQGARWQDVLLVDDCEQYVHPKQERQWIQVDQFAHPYAANDIALACVLDLLERSECHL